MPAQGHFLEMESTRMAHSKDLVPTQFSWIHDLARGEIHPAADDILQLGRSFDPQSLVEESTINLLTEMRDYCEEYARVFNNYSESGHMFSEIKIYSIAQTPADFMVYRNQIKLIASNTAHGVIQLSFTKYHGGGVALAGSGITGNDGSSDASPFADVTKAQEIIAQIGAFRDIFWTFQSEKVEAAQIARFYFAEFVRLTRNATKGRSSNQLLLEQVKALLQEKGLDL